MYNMPTESTSIDVRAHAVRLALSPHLINHLKLINFKIKVFVR